MKKIFFIINCFSKGGGTESLLAQIVNRLNPQKYEIGIMEIIHDNIKEEKLNSNIRLYPYYVEANADNRKEKMYYVYHEWDKVIDEYIPNDFDVYISFNYLKPTFLLPRGKKCIAWIHGDMYNLSKENMLEERMLQKNAFEKVEKIIAISDITYQSIIDLYPEYKEKVVLLCNGIDVKRVRTLSMEKTDIRLKHPAILSVGRLDDNKNPLRLLHIFSKVLEQFPEAQLYYMGYGNQSEKVCEISTKLNISQSVHLLGYHDNPFPIIRQCDVIGMFSKSEGFPMALLEGVALGKPFVSSLFGGARILSNMYGCGAVVDTDVEATEAISRFITMEKTSVTHLCEKTIKEFDISHYIEKIEKIIDTI